VRKVFGVAAFAAAGAAENEGFHRCLSSKATFM
jgi:hypothetical protein